LLRYPLAHRGRRLRSIRSEVVLYQGAHN
jgi:hypothetical protein